MPNGETMFVGYSDNNGKKYLIKDIVLLKVLNNKTFLLIFTRKTEREI